MKKIDRIEKMAANLLQQRSDLLSTILGHYVSDWKVHIQHSQITKTRHLNVSRLNDVHSDGYSSF